MAIKFQQKQTANKKLMAAIKMFCNKVIIVPADAAEVVLTEVGSGARYSGVIYLSPTLEIILSRSLMLEPGSSRMVMRSGFQGFRRANRTITSLTSFSFSILKLVVNRRAQFCFSLVEIQNKYVSKQK